VPPLHFSMTAPLSGARTTAAAAAAATAPPIAAGTPPSLARHRPSPAAIVLARFQLQHTLELALRTNLGVALDRPRAELGESAKAILPLQVLRVGVFLGVYPVTVLDGQPALPAGATSSSSSSAVPTVLTGGDMAGDGSPQSPNARRRSGDAAFAASESLPFPASAPGFGVGFGGSASPFATVPLPTSAASPRAVPANRRRPWARPPRYAPFAFAPPTF